MEELRQKLQAKLESSEGPSTDREQVTRLAGMLKQLAQYKSAYKQATDEEEKSDVKGQVSEFTQHWLDEKLLQLGAKLEN